jgi:sec-independent protein translocase protein TatA
MGELLTPTHLLVITVVALVLFGGKRLPELGKGIGDGLRGFRDGIRGIAGEPDAVTPAPATSVIKPEGPAKLSPAE